MQKKNSFFDYTLPYIQSTNLRVMSVAMPFVTHGNVIYESCG